MAALTLLEARKFNEGTMKRDAIITQFAMQSDVMRAMPFMSIPGRAYAYNIEGQLPGVAFRGINQSYTASVGIINQQSEVLRMLGGEVKVDKFLVDTSADNTGAADVRGAQELMQVKAIALRVANKIINGDSAANAHEFDGLRVRITGNQLIPAGNTSGGDALSLYKLHELIDAVDNPTHLIMSKKMRARLTGAASNPNVSGYITWDKDEFGRLIMMFHGLPILVTDYDDTNSQIIAFNEANPGGGSNVGTSIYCVSFSDEGVVGLQNGGIDVRDLGEMHTEPKLLTRVEWYVAMAVQSGRAAARLYGIKDAAVTA